MQMSVEEPDISDPFIPYDSKDNLLSNLNEDDKKGHQSSE